MKKPRHCPSTPRYHPHAPYPVVCLISSQPQNKQRSNGFSFVPTKHPWLGGRSPTSSALSLICASCVHPPPLLPPHGVAVRLSPFSRGADEAWQLAWIGATRPERPNCCRRPVPSGRATQQPAAAHGQARLGQAHRLPATAPGAERR